MPQSRKRGGSRLRPGGRNRDSPDKSGRGELKVYAVIQNRQSFLGYSYRVELEMMQYSAQRNRQFEKTHLTFCVPLDH